MDLSNCTIGYGVTGSFCTMEKSKSCLRRLARQGATIVPIFSYNVQKMDTRFGRAKENIEEIQDITKNKGIFTIDEAEPIGPKNHLDIMVIAPCTGNTAAKFNLGITDSPVLMAAKAHIRNQKPLVIALATNDAMGANFKNIGELMNTKNVYMVPLRQDDYRKKPNSLVCDMEQIEMTIISALSGKQIQPVILAPVEN
ncbi:MAG: dipicolinate synthase subunit B [Agathobacter sp.]|nr:dipicolinate synthase subunit B [Agathobacter sp.]